MQEIFRRKHNSTYINQYLKEANLKLYCRCNTWGVEYKNVDTGKVTKYRLKRLGVYEDFK